MTRRRNSCGPLTKKQRLTIRKDNLILRALESGKYTVTKDGEIINNDWRNTGEAIPLIKFTESNGYSTVKIYKVGRVRVSRLVALAYLGKPKQYQQAIHKNGIKNDDKSENIKWCDTLETSDHILDNRLKIAPKGESNGGAKLTMEQVGEIRVLLEKKIKHKDIGARYGIARATVGAIKNGVIWK